MNKAIEILNYQKIFDEENQDTELKRLRSNENVAILIAEEKLKWEKINSQKVEESFQKGYQKGLDEGLEELKKQNLLFEKMYQELSSYWYRDREEFTSFLIEIALKIAQEIVGVVEVTDEFVEEQLVKLNGIIDKIDKNLKPSIKVSLTDLEKTKKLINKSELEKVISIDSDPKMLPGEFIVDTNSERWINTRKGLLEAFTRMD
ncbi:MAG: FliH/SctL family protein [Bacteroidota bacterium]|nr:FliH/SctL family protein [Bacteroidota bacterium]